MAKKKKPKGKKSDGDYEVGYSKPPKDTQFKPGQSGNPRGRPKGTKNLTTDLKEELREGVMARERGRSQKISKQRAVIKSVVNRAITGDARSTSIALSMMMRLLDTGEGAPEFEEVPREEDLEILRAFEDRVRQTEDVADPVENDDEQEDAP